MTVAHSEKQEKHLQTSKSSNLWKHKCQDDACYFFSERVSTQRETETCWTAFHSHWYSNNSEVVLRWPEHSLTTDPLTVFLLRFNKAAARKQGKNTYLSLWGSFLIYNVVMVCHRNTFQGDHLRYSVAKELSSSGLGAPETHLCKHMLQFEPTTTSLNMMFMFRCFPPWKVYWSSVQSINKFWF